ncbi:MAG TPA: DNA-processing protein DprA [Arenimonas sp.]|uniref:DNA-processing protein DprA n=1 Tax=Arenimonas sp. TaxID=1872635 RepID=UPI002C4C2EB3|nr:DNA-processing protein DprA [Arenimonas sp.]HMB57802.1 DNA-processing protein DprA [Arenimonas sp.]
MKDARSLLILQRGSGSAAAIRQLLEQFGDADTALDAGPAAWRAAGVTQDRFALLRTPDTQNLDADLRWLEDPCHHLIGWHSPDYPALLRGIGNPPALLFVAGDSDLLWHPQIAMVGSRRPSPGGRDHARQFATSFASGGLVVTSGLAEGIDAAAHDGALIAGRTVAVIASGTDIVYPASNRELMARIRSEGTIVSEHPPGTAPLQSHFPSRNRIVAGLALGTLVVEAAIRSGALITARLAAESGREVFALPGSIDNPMARGCHRLIRQGAALVESPGEVIDALVPMAGQLAHALRGRLALDASVSANGLPRGGSGEIEPIQQTLWQALDQDPATPDQLAERTGLTVAALSAMLLAMELDGHITANHGRYVRRT